ncbi:MAG: DUF447 family protein [Methanoregula sp.]|nr:DUF447 family protein [Methanoregula sp.]
MGILKEGINEVIATTRSGTLCNAAPIGIRWEKGSYSLILFFGSHTFANLERGGGIVANFVFDPVLYVRTAFEDVEPSAFCEEIVGDKSFCRLADAEAWVAFSAMVEKKTPQAMKIRLVHEKEFTEKIGLHPVNRGFNSIIDATVHATRYRLSRDPGLKAWIDYHAGIVRKCGGARELEALEMLLDYIA